MFLGIAVLWGGYALAWWGWCAMTDRVPQGGDGTIWWPSIQDLVIPGKAANMSKTVLDQERNIAGSTAALQAAGNQPLTGKPANPYDPSINPVTPA